MKESVKLRHADAPRQQAIIAEINALLTSRDEEAPRDSYDRVDYRLEIVLASYDNDEPDDPGQPVADLLTDVVHLCEAKGWDVAELLQRGLWMADQERREWGER